MSVMEAYAAQITDAELLDLLARNLVETQKRVIRAEVRSRGLHAFEHLNESVPEACVGCGAAYVHGFHLDHLKRAHIAAMRKG